VQTTRTEVNAGVNINVKPLDFFDAVFLLPSGDVTMNEQQKKDLLAFVATMAKVWWSPEPNTFGQKRELELGRS